MDDLCPSGDGRQFGGHAHAEVVVRVDLDGQPGHPPLDLDERHQEPADVVAQLSLRHRLDDAVGRQLGVQRLDQLLLHDSE